MKSLVVSLLLLLDRIKQKRFEKIYDQYFDKVYLTVRRKIPYGMNVDDITKEVFSEKILPAWQNGSFQNKNDSGLAVTIASNYCYDVIKRRERRRSINFEDNTNSADFLDFPALKIEFQMDLKTGLSALTQQQRQVMEMTISGFKEAEIAAELGKSVGRVAVIKKEARNVLRNFI